MIDAVLNLLDLHCHDGMIRKQMLVKRIRLTLGFMEEVKEYLSGFLDAANCISSAVCAV